MTCSVTFGDVEPKLDNFCDSLDRSLFAVIFMERLDSRGLPSNFQKHPFFGGSRGKAQICWLFSEFGLKENHCLSGGTLTTTRACKLELGWRKGESALGSS